jgi:hypothetical protein
VERNPGRRAQSGHVAGVRRNLRFPQGQMQHACFVYGFCRSCRINPEVETTILASRDLASSVCTVQLEWSLPEVPRRCPTVVPGTDSPCSL